MDITMNHINNHHDHFIKLPIINSTITTTSTTPTTTWDQHLSMVMEDHHNHQNHHHHRHNLHNNNNHQQAHEQHEQGHHNNHHLHHLIPLLDPVWPNFHPLPTPHQSPPSIQLPNSSSSPLITKSAEQISHDHHDNHQEVEDNQEEEEEEELGAMKEMMYRIAVMQPVDIDPATIRKPKRRNVRISDDPQSVAARHRRERISEKIRILQRLVPGGTKMDTASMLDEAVRYVKFLKRQIRQLQNNHGHTPGPPAPPPPPPHHHHLHLQPSDWAVSASLAVVGPTNSKVVLRDDHHHGHENHNHQGIIFQHGGN